MLNLAKQHQNSSTISFTLTRSEVNDFHTFRLTKKLFQYQGKGIFTNSKKNVDIVVLLMFDFTYQQQTSITCKQPS